MPQERRVGVTQVLHWDLAEFKRFIGSIREGQSDSRRRAILGGSSGLSKCANGDTCGLLYGL